MREVRQKASKIKAFSKNFSDYFSARFSPAKTETLLPVAQN